MFSTAAPTAAEEPLHARSTIEGSLQHGASVAFELSVAPEDYVSESLAGGGLELRLLDRSETLVRRLAAGHGERQEFMFVVGEQTPFRLEIRGTADAVYLLSIDRVISRAEQTIPPEEIESPRLRRLHDELDRRVLGRTPPRRRTARRIRRLAPGSW